MPNFTDDEKNSGEMGLEYFLEKTVREQWEKHHKAILSSNLGMVAKENFPDDPRLQKGLFSKFLESSGKFKLVKHPTTVGALAVLPIDANLPADVTDIFPTRQVSTPLSSLVSDSKFLSFDNAFWNAFIAPIPERRYIVVNENMFNIENASSPPQGNTVYEILQTDLTPFDQNEHFTIKAEKTRQKIMNWLERNSLNETIFLKKVFPIRKVNREKGKFDDAGYQLSRLCQAFSKLEQCELSRINIPMDLVIKMLKN